MILVFLIIVFIILSGFFSGSETALTVCNVYKLRHLVEKKSKKAFRTFKLIQKPEDFLTTILVGNNISNVAATSFATYLLVDLFGEYGGILSTIIMTTLLLLFGEVIPKGIFLNKADSISLQISSAIYYLGIVFKPVSFLSNLFSNVIMLFLGVKKESNSIFVTRDEINMMLKEIGDRGLIPSKHKGMISKIFNFTVTPVENILVKKEDIYFIDYRDSKKKIKDLAKKFQYTRYPVVRNSEIIGFLNIFDLFYNKGGWRKYIRPISKFDSATPLDEILKEMKVQNISMAIIEKNSETLGIVTLEDIMEHIVGDIKNEWDRIG